MSDYSQYQGKKVILTQNLKEPNEKGESAVELEGTVEAANALGVMFKPKGQVKAVIIEDADVEEIRLAPTKERAIKARMLKPVEFGQAKSHLLDRHGFTLKAINGMSEEEAFKGHEGIDHVASDLGHVHGVKEKKDQAGEDVEPEGAPGAATES